MSQKISCCMIVRDDASTLGACLASIKDHVDEIVVVDTGSTDGSPEIARKYGAKVETWLGCNDDQNRIENFASARNRSLELAQHDWVFWCDGDDVVSGAEHLRPLAESATLDAVRYLMPYEYAYDDAGNITCMQFRERLLRPRHRLEWISPVHEMCMLMEPVEGTSGDVLVPDKTRLLHRSRKSTKPREVGRNLRILRSYVGRVGEADVRAVYYLGAEYLAAGDIGKALHYLRRYVEIGHWADEKCKALLSISDIYREMGDHWQAIDWAQKAVLQRAWPEPYFGLSRSFYSLAFKLGEEDKGPLHEHHLRRSVHFAELGLSLPQDVILFANPMDRFHIHRYLSVAYSRIGELDKAIRSCEAGLAGLPGDEQMRDNLRLFQRTKRVRALKSLRSEMVAAGDISEAQGVMLGAVLDGQLAVEPTTVQAPELPEMTEPAPGKLDIVFYVGHGVEPWNPETFESVGIGGSETMAWQMARRLSKLGNKVRLYGHCTPSMQGDFEGVRFLDASSYRNLECDVLIVSRQPHAVDESFRVKAKTRLLWVHDIHCGEALTQQRALRFDRILALSNWHKAFLLQVYPSLDPDLIQVTRNGIDLERFKGAEKRNPHRAVYSSSPDRGLLTALECWPRIRKEVPDAELHVYYGFANWEAVAQMFAGSPDPQQRADGKKQQQDIAQLKHLLKTTEGVIMHDRVSQKELAREFMRSGVFAYSTWFSETSCITAMEAQAAGLHVVTSPVAALKETVGDRGTMIAGDWRSSEYADAFVSAVVASLTSDDESRRAAVQAYARTAFGLDALAAEWSEMLDALCRLRRENPMPKFHQVSL